MNPKTQNRRFVVIGGVAAGMSAATAVKRYDPNTEVVVLEKREFISYNTCSLPYYIANVIDDHRRLIELTPERAKQDYQIDVRTRQEAMAVYPKKNTVIVLERETGEEQTLMYDALMLATGGVPISPPVPGINLPNIFQIRTLADGLKLKQYIAEQHPQKATIIGGGYIGLEMAEACKLQGIDVTIIEKFDNLMGTMGQEITELIGDHLQEHQVDLLQETTLDSFEAEDEKCRYVMVDGRTQRIETDMVIIAIGVRPEVALAKGAGLEIGNTGAISVNPYAQTSIENIYAGGDCTEVTHLVSGEKTYNPLGVTARKQGRAAGRNVVQPGCCFFKGAVGTTVSKVFDLEIARTGLSLMEAKRVGFEAMTSTITADSRDRSYPGNTPITITLILDKKSKRLLGAEMAGQEGVAKRIDVFAAALDNRMTVQALTQLDLSYAPPYAPPWDPILVAANVAIKKLT